MRETFRPSDGEFASEALRAPEMGDGRSQMGGYS